MTSEQSRKFDVPDGSAKSDIHPAVESIKRSQRQAFYEVVGSVAGNNDELMLIIGNAIRNDDFVGGRAYTLAEQLSPGITPRIAERMDQLIHDAAIEQSEQTHLG